MSITLSQLGQIALSVDNVDAAEKFYTEQLGLRKLYRFGELLFYDCAGVRLLVERSPAKPFVPNSSILYFRVADIRLVYRELQDRGVQFIESPHLVAPMEDHDLWMAFFKDAAGNTLALMQEAPKGYQPQSI
jgi:methylmalonyl-CoA/ethylmalonyl-CoA epimerase